MESIIFKVIVILLLVGILVFIALGDRRIRKERELEDREQREKQAPGESG